MATPPALPAKAPGVLLWGTYDAGKPRLRILREGMAAANIQVSILHAGVWERFRDKSRMGPRAALRVGMRLLLAYPLLLIRLLTGVTSANIATAFAYIADVTPGERRAGAYGLMQASMSAGFALGPAVGGLFGGLDPRAPFWVAAAFSLLNAAYGFFVVPESLPEERRAPFHFRLASFNAVAVLRSQPRARRQHRSSP